MTTIIPVNIVLITLQGWVNEFTGWNPEDFCGITLCSVKKDMVWTPDITITERSENGFFCSINLHGLLT